MNSSDQQPKVPTWIFVAAYAALIGAAIVIYRQGGNPLSPAAIAWIAVCVLAGAVVLLVPLTMRMEREKNAALDERQRELEALARTVSSSAEQISIAANGLHEIAELAQRNLRQAEQLPQKLQEKIAEFQSQQSVTANAGKEELERELLALRTSESERLEAVSQRIAKSSAEWAKLEAATQQHLTAANEAVAKLAMGTANAIGKAQAAAEQALMQARVEAARVVGDAAGQTTRAIETARAAALADLDAKLAAASANLVERINAELTSRLESLARVPAAEPAKAPAASAEPVTENAEPRVSSTPTTERAPEPKPEPTASTPKRTRKPRRESEPNAPAAVPASPVEEPAPIPPNDIAEVMPVAPVTAEPFSGHIAVLSTGDAATEQPEASSPEPTQPAAAPEVAPIPTAVEEPPASAPRKRAPKKAEADDEPTLGLDLGDSASTNGAGPAESVLTSDGATRLIVTAYIGIGNRLFIRGSGPGLSWDKGVPLQFISIGKWRWETSDASAPVQFKLYKNDEIECAALGEQTLDPGHQQEVTAAF